VNKVDPKVLMQTRDRSICRKLVAMFMRASALFSDLAFCPPDLVLKLFSVMKVAIADLITERNALTKVVNEQRPQIDNVKVRHLMYVAMRRPK
jgi:hypothetical protein